MPRLRLNAAVALFAYFLFLVPFSQAMAATSKEKGERIFQQGLIHSVMACATCHGRDGAGGTGPRLAGLSASYVIRQLQGFRHGRRKSHRMQAVASRLDADQMRLVAAYVERLPIRLPSSTGKTLSYASRRLLVLGDWNHGIPACTDCHGADLLGGGPDIPPLAGQQASYLARQLRSFRDGVRGSETSSIMNHISHGLRNNEIKLLASAISKWPGVPMTLDINSRSILWHPSPQAPSHFIPPVEEEVPPSPQLVAMIREGEHIFVDTPHYAAKFTGNVLSCASCHLNRGRLATAAPMWAALPHFPMYRKKNHRINTIQIRIQGCFKFSENGMPPPVNSHVMTALTAYIHWLATGMPMGAHPKAAGFPRIAAPLKPIDRMRGKQVFIERCAMCHGERGQGRIVRGRLMFPPLWGPASFNLGAGMHRFDKAASFIKLNMPYGAGNTLSNQEAWDVAAYVNSHPRPRDPRTPKM